MSLIALSGRIETDPSEIKNHPNTRLRACLSINTHGVAFACGSSTTMTRCQRRLQTCGHKSASMIDKRTPAMWEKKCARRAEKLRGLREHKTRLRFTANILDFLRGHG